MGNSRLTSRKIKRESLIDEKKVANAKELEKVMSDREIMNAKHGKSAPNKKNHNQVL